MPNASLDRCFQQAGPLRPTFCNVPGWGQALVYLGGLLAVAIFAYGIWRHYALWRAGQPDAPERNRGRLGARIGLLLRYGLGQRATVQRRLPAIFHSGIFYGFVLLFIGTALATIDYDITGLLFDVRFLQGWFYLGYEAVLDLAGVAVIVGLAIAGWRRYVRRPHHVLGSWEVLIWGLLIINLTGFLVEGLRLVFAPVPWGPWSFVGYGLAQVMAGAGLTAEAAQGLHLGFWVFHLVISLALIAVIPFGNAVHMISTPVNLALQPIEERPIGAGAALQPIDIEAAEFFGVGQLSEFTWKQRLGFDACTRCGRCETVCPAYMSGTPLNPKEVIVDLSNAQRARLDAPIGVQDGEAVIVGEGLLVTPDTLFSCTTCMACVEVCPALIEIVDDIVDMRRYLTLTEGALPGTSGATLRNMGTSGNPWGYAPEDRTAWTQDAEVEVPIAQPGEHYEVLYWVGCSGSYDQRNQKISRAFVRLLHEAGVSFAIMAEESCTCESARRLGEEYLYQTATEANVATMQQYTFDRVVCHCPHCFNTIRNEFSQFGGDFDVIHHSQLLGELVDSGRLRLPAGASERVAFHDSCYLGRYNREFDAPRDALRAAGAELVELPRSREDGLCCGGGGGRMWFEAPEETGVNLIRLEEVMEAKPDKLGVACPFCLTMLDSARSSMDVEMPVLDIAELMAESLPPVAGGQGNVEGSVGADDAAGE